MPVAVKAPDFSRNFAVAKRPLILPRRIGASWYCDMAERIGGVSLGLPQSL